MGFKRKAVFCVWRKFHLSSSFLGHPVYFLQDLRSPQSGWKKGVSILKCPFFKDKNPKFGVQNSDTNSLMSLFLHNKKKKVLTDGCQKKLMLIVLKLKKLFEHFRTKIGELKNTKISDKKKGGLVKMFNTYKSQLFYKNLYVLTKKYV